MQWHSDPAAVLQRLHSAMNEHDLEAFLECFDPDYRSEQPVHPDRVFQGREQVQKNWSRIFSGVPDFHAELLRSAVAGDTVWSEWQWTGTQADRDRMNMSGVIIFGVQNDRIKWGRLVCRACTRSGGRHRCRRRSNGPFFRRMTHFKLYRCSHESIGYVKC